MLCQLSGTSLLLDCLPSVNNEKMKDGGKHIMTEEFIGVNSFMVAKRELRGIYAPVKKRGFAPKRVCVWCLARR